MLKVYNNLVNKLKNDLKNKKEIIIAIDGPCTSGKSTLAEYLKSTFNGELIKIDDFFLPPELKTPKRLIEVGGNVYYERFYSDVILNLQKKQPFSYSPYNCQTDDFDKDIKINKNPLIIVEGVYCMREEFLKTYDIKVFLDIDYEKQIKRLEKRSPFLLERFKKEWIPMENKYFSHLDLRNNVDFYVKA